MARPELNDPLRACLPNGTKVGEYRIEHVLGQPGGFGIAYLVTDLELDLPMVMKEYLPRDFARRSHDGANVSRHSSAMSQSFEHGLTRFVEEAQVLARIRHGNVIGVRTCFQANGTAYLVMDYHPGKTLRDHLAARGGKLEYPIAIEVVLRVLDGLEAAHRNGILHRDVKPENIYVLANGNPLLIDFGAARQAVGEHTRKLTAILTPGYAPSEQYGSQLGKQGPWTDVYAAAAVLYRCLTGKIPEDALSRVSGDVLTPPEDLVPAIPHALSDAVTKGLAVHRQERYQTARAFADHLDEIIEHISINGDEGHGLGDMARGLLQRFRRGIEN